MLKTTTSIVNASQITGVLPLANGGTGNTTGTSTAVKSNATTGILQISGPSAAANRTMTVPDANFTVARTDAENSFVGDQTLATGNLIQGAASKGVNFTANTPAAGMTSQLLNWYEEGTWTPTQGAGLTVVGTLLSAGKYTRVGRIVTVHGEVAATTSVACAANSELCGGLPFASSGALGNAMTAFNNTTVTYSVGNSIYCSANALGATGVIYFTLTYQI